MSIVGEICVPHAEIKLLYDQKRFITQYNERLKFLNIQ